MNAIQRSFRANDVRSIRTRSLSKISREAFVVKSLQRYRCFCRPTVGIATGNFPYQRWFKVPL
jgi:hypothetical protein